MASHPSDCTGCPKYLKCELQALMQYLSVSDSRLRKLPGNDYMTEENPLLIRDLTRCVLCGRCVRACKELYGAGILDFHRAGTKTWIAPKRGAGLLKEGDCRFCGSCAAVCPTGAVRDKSELFDGFDSEEKALVPCRNRCPAGIDVPRYTSLIRMGEYTGALAVIREKAPFPLTLGYVCMRFCESACRRKDVNEAIGIRKLKKFAATMGEKTYAKKQAKPTGKKAAVIGAGPAGLTAAYFLAQKGHSVDVFERLPHAGGMLRVGIPDSRLPAEIVDGEINSILEETGVNLFLSREAGTPNDLINSGYDVVIVATGAHKGKRLSIPGNGLAGVVTAVEFLASPKAHRKAVVIGGGNVAFDSARTAKRLGAEQVTVACLEAREDMSACREEIDAGLAEGIEILNSRSFVGIRQDGSLWVDCLCVKSFCFEDGNLHIEPEPDSEHMIETDIVIFAVGQETDRPEFLVETEGVFSCGDCVSGTASVIEAIASGRVAASNADRFLGGDGDISVQFMERTERSICSHVEGFADIERPTEWNDETILCEAGRCLQCDLRLEIPKVEFWSEYAVR